MCKARDIQKEEENDSYVVLLHGLARTNRSMKKIAKTLSKKGYSVININYPSTAYPIEYLSDEILGKKVEPFVNKFKVKIHFVTHSIGGIVVRWHLKYHPISNLGRVVMLSPPNQGSEIVDKLRSNIIFKKWHGPAGQQVGTKVDSVPLTLGPVDFELGVITGNWSYNPIASLMIPGQDDGSVSVERARIKGMKDFLVVPHSHTFIIRKKGVINQVIHFLENGEFDNSARSQFLRKKNK